MHIDATILPLKRGVLVYNPLRTSEVALRKHAVLNNWELHAYPFVPRKRDNPPLFMTSEWLCMNVLSISDTKVIVEKEDVEFAEWVRQFGIEPIPMPMQHVHSIGGSFHCATVDLVRCPDES
jgi:glycine amidinotransferase